MRKPSLHFNVPGQGFLSWLAIFISSISLFVACNRLPTLGQLNYTRQQPNRLDLVGVWIPDHSSLQGMRKRGGYETSVQTSLVLKEDGNFELVHMPDWWSSAYGESTNGFEDYAGTWRVGKFGTDLWTLELRPQTGTKLSGTRFANLIGQAAPYQIEFIIGDADEGLAMIFTKR